MTITFMVVKFWI